MKNIHFIAGAIVIAGVMVSGAVVYSSDSNCDVVKDVTDTPDSEKKEETFKVSDIEIEGWPTKGDPDAPVVIVEYSDYVCPFCKKLNDETTSLINKDYVESGQVLLVFKDFPVVGGDRAAEAAHCAGDQDAYWEYHDILFENQQADRAKWGDSEVHREYADVLSLDSDRLAECFIERKYRDKVISSAREAQSIGGRGTPFVVINQQRVSGAQSYQVFEQMIERELAN